MQQPAFGGGVAGCPPSFFIDTNTEQMLQRRVIRAYYSCTGEKHEVVPVNQCVWDVRRNKDFCKFYCGPPLLLRFGATTDFVFFLGEPPHALMLFCLAQA